MEAFIRGVCAYAIGTSIPCAGPVIVSFNYTISLKAILIFRQGDASEGWSNKLLYTCTTMALSCVRSVENLLMMLLIRPSQQ